MTTRQPQSRRSASRKRAEASSASLTEQAYTQLEQMIATLELRPGAFVSESDLCERLGIGRTPVREAMQRLAREHLLQIMPRKGCVVSDCRFDDELSVIEVRKPLELVVARGAAQRARPEQRQRFAEIADDIAAALDGNDFDAFARLDLEFNQLCLAACGNATATSMMRLISTQNRRFWFMHHGRTLPREGVESHVDIARAIADGDADRAAAAAERLLAYVEQLALRSRPM
ncbi:GntR family transcriptional regulator [Bradyrhizobium sp. 192]|uniref:GntR family transcriptional regulator n=1 Tax=Bradyrhizobium sp. 192 TaxID=2782660 RepID=UPI001FFF947A|nr:GntR family transcriptional regulator [Bradyrhizobium sp. 192]UPJ59288.1 GntR family transcriptional regulator [Bradyrhizobium sp. 192]